MTAVLNDAPIPLSDPIARPKREQFGKRKDPQEGLITEPWVSYLSQQSLVISQSMTRINSVSLTNQSASIGATDMSGGVISAGLYEIKYYARITQAATTSSSLTITFDWTDGAVSPSVSGTAITGNTTSTVQSGSYLIRVDNLSPVRYSTTYGSVGATPMKHSLYITLSEVQA